MYMTTDLIKVCMDKITERERREEKSVEMTIKYPDLLKKFYLKQKKKPKENFFLQVRSFCKKKTLITLLVFQIYSCYVYLGHMTVSRKRVMVF